MGALPAFGQGKGSAGVGRLRNLSSAAGVRIYPYIFHHSRSRRTTRVLLSLQQIVCQSLIYIRFEPIEATWIEARTVVLAFFGSDNPRQPEPNPLRPLRPRLSTECGGCEGRDIKPQLEAFRDCGAGSILCPKPNLSILCCFVDHAVRSHKPCCFDDPRHV